MTVGWGNQYGGQVAMHSRTDMLAKGIWLGVSFSEQIMTIGFSFCILTLKFSPRDTGEKGKPGVG